MVEQNLPEDWDAQGESDGSATDAYYPEKRGMLKKRSGSFIEVWYDRLCVMKRAQFYYGRRSDLHPIGCIPLNHDNIYEQDGEHFSIHCPALKGGTFHFEAESEPEATAWMGALRECGSKKALIQHKFQMADKARKAAEMEK